MGKIFGICDNPVSIPTTPFEPIEVPKPVYYEIRRPQDYLQKPDRFVSKNCNSKNINRVVKFMNRFVKTISRK